MVPFGIGRRIVFQQVIIVQKRVEAYIKHAGEQLAGHQVAIILVVEQTGPLMNQIAQQGKQTVRHRRGVEVHKRAHRCSAAPATRRTARSGSERANATSWRLANRLPSRPSARAAAARTIGAGSLNAAWTYSDARGRLMRARASTTMLRTTGSACA